MRATTPADPPAGPWAERAESASVAAGTAAAVLALGLLVAAVWFRLWGVALADVAGLTLAAAIDVVLLLLAVALHHLAVDLDRGANRS